MRPFHTLAAVAAAATLVLSPVAAFAALPQPAIGPIDAPTVGYLVDVAESYWQPNPCAGHTQVHAISRNDAAASHDGDMDIAGFAPDIGSVLWPVPSCDIWIVDDSASGWDVRKLCQAITHEIGHDIGYRHVFDDPTNVMYPTIIASGPPACDAAQRQITPDAAPAPVTEQATPIAVDDVDATPVTHRTRWPTPRVLRIGRDAHGRVALRVANSASPQLTVRFYRASQTVLPGLKGEVVVKKVVARVDHAAFENAAATAVIVAPKRWDALDAQLTGGQRKPGTARWLSAQAVHDWRDARGPVSGQGAPSAGAEFGGDRGGRASPVLTGCTIPLSCR